MLSISTLMALISLCLFTFALTAALSLFAACCAGERGSFPTSSDERRERYTAWGWLLLFGVVVTILQYVIIYMIVHPPMDFFRSF